MVNLGRRSRHSGVPDHSRQIATFSTPTTIQGRYGKNKGGWVFWERRICGG